MTGRSRQPHVLDDPDIRHAAHYLLDRDGDRAQSTALGRAVDLYLAGEIEAAKIWKQIVDAIAELEAVRSQAIVKIVYAPPEHDDSHRSSRL